MYNNKLMCYKKLLNLKNSIINYKNYLYAKVNKKQFINGIIKDV